MERVLTWVQLRLLSKVDILLESNTQERSKKRMAKISIWKLRLKDIEVYYSAECL